MSEGKVPDQPSRPAEVDAFLKRVAATPRAAAAGRGGRLLFAMDATASRGPTWDHAARIQAEMFSETAALGGLSLQLAFFRGFGEFQVSPWLTDSRRLLRLMTSVVCRAGETQLRKVLIHAANEARRQRVDALVYIGDCLEEDVDAIGHAAGELGVLGVPAFMFHEGGDPVAGYGFREVARLTRGAYCPFDSASPHVLRELLSAVAVYAAGGRPALEDLAAKRGGEVLRLAHRLRGG